MSNQITPNPSVPSQVVAEVKFPQVINNLGIIPTSYKDSMSYYECLAWLCKYLEETVIPSVNQNGNAVQELQNLYIELNSYVTHYFDTLDVQEEINNKLDDMTEQGTLQEIIAEYINANALWCFDTVADMKSASNLIEGSFAKTLGYYSINDGGGAIYKIKESSTSYYETLDSNLVAELIVNEKINVECFGAKHYDENNPYDCTEILSTINSLYNNITLSSVEFIYIDNDDLLELSNINFDKFKLLLEANDSHWYRLEIENSILNNCYFKSFNKYADSYDSSLIASNVGIYFSENCYINNSLFENLLSIELINNSNSTVENSIFKNCTSGILFEDSENISVNNCKFDMMNSEENINFHHAIYIGGNTENINISNLYIHNGQGFPLASRNSKAEKSNPKNITFENITLTGNLRGISATNATNLRLINIRNIEEIPNIAPFIWGSGNAIVLNSKINKKQLTSHIDEGNEERETPLNCTFQDCIFDNFIGLNTTASSYNTNNATFKFFNCIFNTIESFLNSDTIIANIEIYNSILDNILTILFGNNGKCVFNNNFITNTTSKALFWKRDSGDLYITNNVFPQSASNWINASGYGNGFVNNNYNYTGSLA